MNSQNREEEIFKDYFKGFKGYLLEVGANDGQTLSNSFGLINIGWSAVLVEPSVTCLEKLNVLYRTNTKVKIAPYALGLTDGEVDYWESSSLLTAADHSLVSTIVPKEKERWSGIDISFEKKIADCLTWDSFYKKYPNKYDLISIDIEGVDFDLLTQMDLNKIGCKLICVETNGKDTQKYADYISQFGHKVIHTNAENLIMAI